MNSKKTNLNKYCDNTRKAIRYAIAKLNEDDAYCTDNRPDCEVFINDFKDDTENCSYFTDCLSEKLGDAKGWKISLSLGINEFEADDPNYR